jgi:hypothetical protein
MTPGASDDVRIAELGIRPQDARGHGFLIADEVVAAKQFSRGDANDLSAQRLSSHPFRSSSEDGGSGGARNAGCRSGSLLVRAWPRDRVVRRVLR